MKETQLINNKEYTVDVYNYYSDLGGIKVNGLILNNGKGDGSFNFYVVNADWYDFISDKTFENLNIYAPVAQVFTSDTDTEPKLTLNKCYIFKKQTSFYFVI